MSGSSRKDSGAEAGPPIRRRFLRLTWINILSNVTVPLAGLVDTAMLGHLDEIHFLAGVALGTVLFDYVYWTFGFLRMGTTGMTAQAEGRGDRSEIAGILHRSAGLAALIAMALLVLQLPLRELGFALLSGTPEVESAGRAYFDARIWGAPATLTNFVLIGWLLGRERSRDVLVLTIVGNLANILLNYLFIMRLGWAAAGAGWATATSQWLMLAAGLALVFRYPVARAWERAVVLHRERLTHLFRLNRDILIRTLLLVSGFAVFTNFSSILGTERLAANTILLRWLYVAAYLIDGAAFACESLAGHFRGRRDAETLRRLTRLSLSVGLLFAGLVLALFFAAPRPALALLTSHRTVIDLALGFAPWLIPVVLIGSLAYMYDGLFLGLSEGRALRNAMLVSFLVFLPFAAYAVRLQSNHLLWASLALFMVARVATLGWAARGLPERIAAGS